MAESFSVGAHWALVAIRPDAGNATRWVGYWALYQSFSLAMYAGEPEQRSSVVSGRTASHASVDDARDAAGVDVARTEAVLSGTYRD